MRPGGGRHVGRVLGGGGGVQVSRCGSKLAGGAAAQEFLFRGIQKQEWDNLFQFISVKGLPIANLAEAQQGPGGAARTLDIGLDAADIDSGAHPALPGLRPVIIYH